MAKKSPQKKGVPQCSTCIHEYACSMQCRGNPMCPDNALRCACYEDVRSSSAYLIGFIEGKRSQSGDEARGCGTTNFFPISRITQDEWQRLLDGYRLITGEDYQI